MSEIDPVYVEVPEGTLVIFDEARFMEMTKAVAVHNLPEGKGVFVLTQVGEWKPVEDVCKVAKGSRVRAIKGGTDSTGPQ